MKIFEDYRLRRALKRKAKRLRKAGRLIGITTDTDLIKFCFALEERGIRLKLFN